jgi:hypothetical protein
VDVQKATPRLDLKALCARSLMATLIQIGGIDLNMQLAWIVAACQRAFPDPDEVLYVGSKGLRP